MIKGEIKSLAPRVLISWYHFLWALAGAVIFGFPSKKIKVIGLTGTNGKTTTVELTAAILKEAGYKVAVLSSIKFQIGNEEKKNELRMTMPGRAMVQRFLKQAVKAKCDYALLEVTSEGVVQHRHRFIDFEAAVLTNLSPEHIESHGSFENYRHAKLEFFNSVKKIHILNADDESFEYFNRFSPAKKYFYGFERNRQDLPATNFIAAENVQASASGVGFLVKNSKFKLNLFGGFNVYNALAAISVALSQGIGLPVCQRALGGISGIGGRMEIVIEEPFKVFVDYAFTPNALEQVYRAIRSNWPNGKMICVLGACGGGRDKWKRPVLGGLAAKYCQKAVLTNEDPYDEDPNKILLEIKSGIANEKDGMADVILDRREAIKKALIMAEPNDVVIITGKGCEPSICLAGGKKMPWDDRQVAEEEFKKIYEQREV